ncbi:Uncharacterised protein [Mycobacteroides abscessus subsp. massiliense]|nr:Uncharacterised protein [Mycobacteroides abscessus subsp. massiliense]
MRSKFRPTSSRIGRLRKSVDGRSANLPPIFCTKCASMRVLYSSEAATNALNNGRPSMASQRGTPSAPTARTLLLIATWVCRSGSPARLSRCVNAVAMMPSVSI